MKKVLVLMLVVVAVLFMSGVAFANQTGRGNYTTAIPPLTQWLNSNDGDFLHDHAYSDKYNDYKRNNPLGVGLDVILYEFEGGLHDLGLDAIEAQSTYDFMNREVAVFGKVKMNAWRLVKNMFGE